MQEPNLATHLPVAGQVQYGSVFRQPSIIRRKIDLTRHPVRVLVITAAVIAGCYAEPWNNFLCQVHRAWILLCVLFYVAGRLLFAADSESFSIWCAVILVEGLATVGSILYAQSVFQRRQGGTKSSVVAMLITTVSETTTVPQHVNREIRTAVVGGALSIFAVGLLASLTEISIASHIDNQLGTWNWVISLVFKVSIVFSKFASVAGLGMFGVVCLLHRVRVRSTFRALKRCQTCQETKLEEGVDRVFGVDRSLATFSIEHTFGVSGLIMASFLELFFSGLYMTTNDTPIDTTVWLQAKLGARALIDSIVLPGLMLALCLIPAAALNQSCEILKGACMRFLICKRFLTDSQDERTLKHFGTYVKTSDIVLRIQGFVVDTKLAWQVIVVTGTTFYAAAHLKAA